MAVGKLWIVLVLLLIPVAAQAAITSANLVNTADNTSVAMNYDEATTKAFIDQAASNPDVTLRICAGTPSTEIKDKYGTFVYKSGNGSNYQRVAGMSDADMGQFTSCDASCCNAPDTLNFLSLYSVYPANVYAVLSDDTTIDASDTFIYIPTANGWLNGYYTTNTVYQTYNQATGNVSIDITAIYGYHSGYQSITTDKNYIVVSVCNITTSGLEKFVCSSNAKTNLTASGVSLFTGVVSPADTSVTYKNYVINGINATFCIGPDLAITSAPTLNPSSGLPGQIVNITATVTNPYNVDVTNNFRVAFYVAGNNVANSTDIAGLTMGNSVQRSYILNTSGMLSGGKSVYAKVLDKHNGYGSVDDCNYGNDQSPSTTLTIIKGYYLNVYVNGVLTDNFARSGRPYNVSVHVFDTDSGSTAGLTLKITEKNGMNLFAPEQGFIADSTKKGVVSYATAEVTTNSTGAVDFALIPTGNKLFLPEYSYLNASDYIGNYSMYIELYNGATRLQVSQAGYGQVNQYTLTLGNHTAVNPSSAEENSIFVTNHNQYVQIIINWFNQVYSSVSKWTGVV